LAEVVSKDPHVGNAIKFVRISEKDRATLKEFVERMLTNCTLIERARRSGRRNSIL